MWIDMKYDTVVFDLDGTLLDTLADLADSTNHALSLCGFPPRDIEEIRAFVGNGVAKLIARAVPAGTDEARTADCLAQFQAHYRLNLANKTAPYPGVLALLARLRGDGCKLAIVSNKFDGAVKPLAGAYFPGLIDVAVGERPSTAKKPAPDLVRIALEEMRTLGARAVYVGDSEVDVETAQNAALPFIGVSWGFRGEAFLRRCGAESVARDTEALYQMLTT